MHAAGRRLCALKSSSPIDRPFILRVANSPETAGVAQFGAEVVERVRFGAPEGAPLTPAMYSHILYGIHGAVAEWQTPRT